MDFGIIEVREKHAHPKRHLPIEWHVYLRGGVHLLVSPSGYVHRIR